MLSRVLRRVTPTLRRPVPTIRAAVANRSVVTTAAVLNFMLNVFLVLGACRLPQDGNSHPQLDMELDGEIDVSQRVI